MKTQKENYKPRVSVVMPVYNSEKYLAEAIESILNQTYKDFEFIVAYDQSTDNSLEIIKKYMADDERVILLELDNLGLVESLNRGIELARGDYIARMDADDISMPERFQKQVDYLDVNPGTSILASYVEIKSYSEDNKINLENWFNRYIDEHNQDERLSYGAPIAHPSVMMRANFAKAEKYDASYSYMEDYELWMRASKNNYKISVLEEKLIVFKDHEDSKSSKEKKEDIIKQRIRAKMHYYYPKDKQDLIIWGMGASGEMLVDYILNSKWGEIINIVALVDKNARGLVEGYEIIKPEEIDNYHYNYILISSGGGHREISKSLDEKGLSLIKDYMYVL